MRREGKTTRANLEERFEAGEDVVDYFDLEKATHPNREGEVRRVNVDMPSWMIEGLDVCAGRLAINRQALIKTWLSDRLKSEGIVAL